MSIITPAFHPYPHQKPFIDFFMSGGLRSVLVWPRRHGKDLTSFNCTWIAAQNRVGAYYYFLPTYSQARKIIWNGIDGGGKKFMDYIPSELIAKTHDTDMRVHFTNGSILQLVGSDNIDSIVGTNPVGCIFSEYALQDPRGWHLVSPILRQNGGWAVFIYTPRGHNHGYDLYQSNKNNPKWFVELLTISDTGLITEEDLDDERAAGIPEEIIQQEYYCSFNLTNAGSYFGKQMVKAEEQNRIRELTYDPRYLVHTAWDLGVNDLNTIWFIQYDGRTVWAIDYYENHDLGLDHYKQVLTDKQYAYGTHLAPHDVMKRSQRDGTSLLEWAANELGLYFTKVDRRAKIDQLAAAHMLIPRTVFCSVNCERGIEGLKEYEREWDQKAKTYRNTPKHNWASHIADAYMVLACGIDSLSEDSERTPYSSGAFNPREYERYGNFDPRPALHQKSTSEEYYPNIEVTGGFSRR